MVQSPDNSNGHPLDAHFSKMFCCDNSGGIFLRIKSYIIKFILNLLRQLYEKYTNRECQHIFLVQRLPWQLVIFELTLSLYFAIDLCTRYEQNALSATKSYHVSSTYQGIRIADTQFVNPICFQNLYFCLLSEFQFSSVFGSTRRLFCTRQIIKLFRMYVL